MAINEIRERINLLIYDSKERVFKILNAISVFVSIAAVGVIIFLHGWSHEAAEEQLLYRLLQGSFGFYVFRYIIRFIYDFEPKKFLKRTRNLKGRT